jgi:streptogramin lyase
MRKKRQTRSATPQKAGFRFRPWWVLAVLVIALPLLTIVQAWGMILAPSDCNSHGETTSSGAVAQFCFPNLTPLYGQGNMTIGPDGSLWFAETNRISRITPTGRLTSIVAQSSTFLSTGLIVSGPDGNLWFLEGNDVGQISPTGLIHFFGAGVIDSPSALTVGPDGNLWLGNAVATDKAATIVKLMPSGEITSFSLPLPSHTLLGSGIIDLAAGADGNLWFLENVTLADPATMQATFLGSMTPSGSIKQAPAEVDRGYGLALGGGIGPIKTALASGPDGNLWVLQHDGQIERITREGVITHFPILGQPPEVVPILITGPDGKLWFSAQPGMVGCMTQEGMIKLLPLPAQTRVGGLAASRDGYLWFLNAGDTQRGSVWWVHVGRLTL